MADRHLPSIKKLHKSLRYDPTTGKLFWKDRVGVDQNEAFTFLSNRGYYRGQVEGKWFLAHRVAWAIYHGSWPSHEVDHINGDQSDNRIKNLRNVTHQENLKNQGLRSDNPFGVIGVSRVGNRWRSRIKVGGVTKNLGYYSEFDDAAAARKSAERKYGFHSNHGQRKAPSST